MKIAVLYVILLAILGVIFVMCGVAVGVLSYVPSVPSDLHNGTQLYKNRTVFVPISRSISSWTKWLTYFSFSINATKCEGDLYEVPCNQLKRHLSSYDIDTSDIDFIYCLNNSSFNVTWNSSSDAGDTFIDFWITSNFNIALDYRFDTAPNCSSPVPDHPQSTCRRLTPENSSAIVVTNASSECDGQYYFLVNHAKESSSVRVHVNQFYYDISDYPNPVNKDRVGQVSDVKVPLRSTFQPTNFSIADNDCFIMHVNEDHCHGDFPPNMLYVHSFRRGDVIFWPCLAAAVTLLVPVCVLVTHVAIFIWRRKMYFQERELRNY